MSDHSLCLSVFNHSSVKHLPRAFTSRFLLKKRLIEFSLLLKKYPWELYNLIMDPNDRWNAIIKCAITMMLDEVAPVKNVLLEEQYFLSKECSFRTVQYFWYGTKLSIPYNIFRTELYFRYG